VGSHVTADGIVWDEVTADSLSEGIVQRFSTLSGVAASASDLIQAISRRSESWFMRLKLKALAPVVNATLYIRQQALRVLNSAA
jgi:hypothetical protein